ncbi:uncharacterized protein LOC131245789 [Magnolia sinica]|uniref:uncharacterized protein LOC131245789 n=1 Tax=Magnolia sinica TaxID=86752 RepID=UPI002659E179|nr:uncharacterized protein LOC131245789 [Magnolia sinica]
MVPVLCRFGGDLIRESINLYYKGGTNRIVYVDRAIDYHNLLFKVRGICKLTDISSIEYKYPGLYLDSLVSIVDDDNVSNMMEAFPKSGEPIQLFISGAQDLSKPITISSNLMQNADNGNVQASSWGLHESNKRPSTHNINTNNNDVPSVSNDLHRIDCLSMDSSVNGMPKMMSILNEGQEFENANAFDKALREYAIRSNFQYKRTRSGGGHFQAKCINDDCSWRINACKLADKSTVQIISLKKNHTCNAVNESTMSNPTMHQQASRKWIASLVKDRLQKKLCCTPKDIVDEISREYKINVSYGKAWRGKELALKEMHSDESIQALRMLCKEIESTNPGSTAKCSRSSGKSLRLFVAYKAAICGLKQACRPLVMLECIKIEGRHTGAWLLAMAIDAEDDEFPVSCAFVESKNVGNWKWFCGELAQVLGYIPKLTFTLDRQEGILEVVSGIFPYACHRYSQGRLVEEILQTFNCSDLEELFTRATYATDRSEFNACMRKIHDKYKDAWNIVKDINPKHWATSHFEEKLYVWEDFFIYRMCSWRDKLESWRDLDITSALENLHLYMIEIFNGRFKKSLNWETTLVPRAEKVISAGEMCSGCYYVSGSAEKFDVLYEDGANAEKVDLERQTCSCYWWKICGYPCIHAIQAIRYSGGNVYDYFDVHYNVSKYHKTYSEDAVFG